MQKEPASQRRGVEESSPHTLHLIKGPQEEVQEEEDPEVKRMVDRAKMVTAAQYYVKDGNEGLVEIGAEGGWKPPERKMSSEPEANSIPPW